MVGFTVLAIFYLFVAFIVFLSASIAYGDRYESHEFKVRAARIAILSPVWPVLGIVLFYKLYVFVTKLWKTAWNGSDYYA